MIILQYVLYLCYFSFFFFFFYLFSFEHVVTDLTWDANRRWLYIVFDTGEIKIIQPAINFDSVTVMEKIQCNTINNKNYKLLSS
jgi:hypothetical protein